MNDTNKRDKSLIIATAIIMILTGFTLDTKMKHSNQLTQDELTINIEKEKDKPTFPQEEWDEEINVEIKDDEVIVIVPGPSIPEKPVPEKPTLPNRDIQISVSADISKIDKVLPGDIRDLGFSSRVLFDESSSGVIYTEKITIVGNSAYGYNILDYDMVQTVNDDGVPMSIYTKTSTATSIVGATNTHSLEMKMDEYETRQENVDITYTVSAKYIIGRGN